MGQPMMGEMPGAPTPACWSAISVSIVRLDDGEESGGRSAAFGYHQVGGDCGEYDRALDRLIPHRVDADADSADCEG